MHWRNLSSTTGRTSGVHDLDGGSLYQTRRALLGNRDILHFSPLCTSLHSSVRPFSMSAPPFSTFPATAPHPCHSHRAGDLGAGFGTKGARTLAEFPKPRQLSVATGKHHFTDRGNTVAFSCVLAEASRTLASSGSKATLTLLPRRGPMWHSCSTICILSMDKEGSSAAHYISERVNKKLTAAASERTTFTRNQSNQGASPGNAKQNLYNL